MASKQKRVELTVQAEDTYNPADYIQVHMKFFEGMRNAMRAAHGPDCMCIYCGRDEQPSQETLPALDMSGQPMGDPHPADLTRHGQCPICGVVGPCIHDGNL